MKRNIAVGRQGEDHAHKFLLSQNYKILARNTHSRYGEIDILAYKISHPNQLVFIEVKTRSNNHFGHPIEGLTKAKYPKLLKTIYLLWEKYRQQFSCWRLGLIAIRLDSGAHPQIEYLKNIFDG